MSEAVPPCPHLQAHLRSLLILFFLMTLNVFPVPKQIRHFLFNLARCCYFLLQNLRGILWLTLWELRHLYDCEWTTVCPIQIPQLYLRWEIHERLRPPLLQNEPCPPWYLIRSSPSVAPGKQKSSTPTVVSVPQQLCHGGFQASREHPHVTLNIPMWRWPVRCQARLSQSN